jgi:hypothetical protein
MREQMGKDAEVNREGGEGPGVDRRVHGEENTTEARRTQDAEGEVTD